MLFIIAVFPMPEIPITEKPYVAGIFVLFRISGLALSNSRLKR
jgi:hypothetical protein